MAEFYPITNDSNTVDEALSLDIVKRRIDALTPAAVTGAAAIQQTQPYWDGETNAANVTSYEHAQVFTVGQIGWLTKVGVYFSRLAVSGGCVIKICEVDNLGRPDTARVLSTTTVARGDLLVAGAVGVGLPSLVETVVPITPCAVVAGRRYAMVLCVLGDHYIAISEDDDDLEVVGGSFFYAIDGVWQPQIGCIKHRLYFAVWTDSRFVVELEPLQLSGGIRSIDVIGKIACLGDSKAILEGQVGGVWKPIDVINTIDLSTLPAVLPLRVVFVGMSHAHACAVLTEIKLRLWRCKTAFKYVSATRNLGSNAATVVVKLLLAGYIENNHDCTVVVKTNAGGTTETADTTTDAPKPGGLIERTFTFNIVADNDYFYEITGATNSVHSLFKVVEAIDYAVA